MRLVGLALGLVAACSFPTKHFTGGGDGGGGGGGGDGSSGTDARATDAPAGGDAGGAYACAGHPFPTTAPATIDLKGSVINSMNQPAAQVMVVGVDATNGNSFASQLTNASGMFDMQVGTNGQAINGYFEINLVGQPYVPAMVYPAQPFHADMANIQLDLYDPNTLQQLYSSVGAQWDNTSATMVFAVVDCNGNAVAGAQLKPNISGPQPQAIHYANSAGGIDPSQTTTSNLGLAVAFGQPPNGASYTAVGPNGQTFHTYSYQLISRAFVLAFIQP